MGVKPIGQAGFTGVKTIGSSSVKVLGSGSLRPPGSKGITGRR